MSANSSKIANRKSQLPLIALIAVAMTTTFALGMWLARREQPTEGPTSVVAEFEKRVVAQAVPNAAPTPSSTPIVKPNVKPTAIPATMPVATPSATPIATPSATPRLSATTSTPMDSAPTRAALERDGAFGFPQAGAEVLCDRPDLRVSFWNNDRYFCVQAIAWTDDSDERGEFEGRADVGDHSTLSFASDPNRRTWDLDRGFLLNNHLSTPGMYYSTRISPGGSSGMQDDSQGRGAIRYVTLAGGPKVRIDTFVVPLVEVRKKPGELLSLGVYIASPKPLLDLQLLDEYKSKTVKLAQRATELDLAKFPEDRKTIRARDLGKPAVYAEEFPRHRIVIRQPLLVGRTEVTLGQFKKFIAATSYKTMSELPPGPNDPKLRNPNGPRPTYASSEHSPTDNHPVCYVAWNDAVAFCNWLSQAENLKPCYVEQRGSYTDVPDGNGFRLPTEAEWEYACRAGTDGVFPFGDDPKELERFAWFDVNSKRSSQPVATKAANAFGLFDMLGNVAEFCQDSYVYDWYEKATVEVPNAPVFGSTHVLRGGRYDESPPHCRPAYRRLVYMPKFASQTMGFRIVRALSAPQSPPPSLVAPYTAAKAEELQKSWSEALKKEIEAKNSVGADLILIPPGEFMMGTSEEQLDRILKP